MSNGDEAIYDAADLVPPPMTLVKTYYMDAVNSETGETETFCVTDEGSFRVQWNTQGIVRFEMPT